MNLRVIAFILAAQLTACAHSVHQVYVSDFIPHQKAKSGRIIHAHHEESSSMGLMTDLDYVDLFLAEFMRKCPEGIISGITTEYATDLGFLSWANHLYLTGQCLEGYGSEGKKT